MASEVDEHEREPWLAEAPVRPQEARRAPLSANGIDDLGRAMGMTRRAQEIRQHPQSQASLTAQLYALRVAARRLGFYDADDWLAEQGV